MIKYNLNTINDWFFSTDNIIKVYRNNAICYYKIDSSSPSGQTPCFAVVDDITQYSDTEFEDVFNKADEKWYKLNNLNQYEEYGIYGSGRTITYYEGKLTIDDGYEYQYSGSGWNNVGEVSGGTATLPDISFSLNYNAKEYDSTNNQIPQTSGQLQNVDAVCNYGYHIIDHSADGYISITGNSRFICSGNSGTYLNRTNTQTGCTMTIVSKAKTNSGYSILTNRQGNGTTHLNWMYRQYADGYMKLHGKTDTQQIACSTTEPNILSVRTLYNGGVKSYMNNWSLGTSTSQATFAYLNTGTIGGALFCDYSDVNTEFWQGDFYWIYMSQNVLTDEQIQQVIDYNEEGGGGYEYPLEYVVREDPPNNLVFSSMTEAESYECPYVGMVATIDGDNYVFSGDSQSGYEWVEKQTDWYTLQDLINTHTVVSIGNNKFRFDPTVNGISYFRVHTDKVSGSNTYVDLYNDNLPSPPYFGIKDDSNISLYTSVDGYSNLKSAANSSTCTWAYWIDANTIEVNAQAIMNDTMNIGFYTSNYPKLLLSFELPTV